MFIKDLNCISPQATFDGGFFESDPVIHNGSQYPAIEPSYAGKIPNGLLRRMGKSNRMITGSGMALLEKWKTDGIIIGTTDGGMDDCHKFLNQIIAYEEGTLTPTTFVNGAPSSPAGGLALMSKNSGYNNTHSNKGLSFENCLMDATLLFEEGAADRLLIGCVEEISPAQFRIETLAGYIKKEEISADKLLPASSPGAVNGEGTALFVVEPTPENAIAEIVDFDMISHPENGDLELKIDQLLSRQNLNRSDIDHLILGYAGDSVSDHYYDEVAALFPSETGTLAFKNMFGENPSASSFATWYAAHLLSGKKAPEMSVVRVGKSAPKTVLVYNHYQGAQHGFVLMRKV